MLKAIAAAIGSVFLAIGAWFSPVQTTPEPAPSLGADITAGVTEFVDSLAAPITASSTSFTLVRGTASAAGSSLSGTYIFKIDGEFIEATCAGVSCTVVRRGLSDVDMETELYAQKKAHGRGAPVKITDAYLVRISRALTGSTALDSGVSIGDFPITYPSEPTWVDGTHQLVTWDKSKSYTDSVAIAGAPNASESVTGIVTLATAAQTGAGTSASADGARLVVPASIGSSSYTGTQKVVVTQGNGIIAPGFLPTASSVTWSGALDTEDFSIRKEFMARETIAANDAVIFQGTTTTASTVGTTADTSRTLNDTTWYAEVFETEATTVNILSVEVNLRHNTCAPAGTITASIRAAAGGVPTGADLASTTTNASVLSASFAWIPFVFATPVTASGDYSDYAVVLRRSEADAGCDVYWNTDGNNPRTNWYNAKSVNSGGSWAADSNPTYELWTRVITTTYQEGLYQADASATTTRFGNAFVNNFVGFAAEAGNAGDQVSVIVSGISGGRTNLTTGSTYYLSNTPGIISETPGTNTREVGLSVSSTEVLVRYHK